MCVCVCVCVCKFRAVGPRSIPGGWEVVSRMALYMILPNRKFNVNTLKRASTPRKTCSCLSFHLTRGDIPWVWAYRELLPTYYHVSSHKGMKAGTAGREAVR